jgi:hypothetical protein
MLEPAVTTNHCPTVRQGPENWREADNPSMIAHIGVVVFDLIVSQHMNYIFLK